MNNYPFVDAKIMRITHEVRRRRSDSQQPSALNKPPRNLIFGRSLVVHYVDKHQISRGFYKLLKSDASFVASHAESLTVRSLSYAQDD
jgi:hypothetical protein